MVPINRREFVAASGLVAVAGCLARGSEDDDAATDDATTDDDSLPEAFATVLDPVPTSVENAELRQLYVASPDPESSSNQSLMATSGRELGLDAEDVDRGLTAIYGEFDGRIGAVAGSFEADDLEEPERAAASIEDGRVLTAASTGEPWDAGLEAAEAAADDPDVGVDGETPVESLFGPVAEREFVVGLMTVDGETIPDDASIDTEAVEAIALGRTSDVEAREETVTFVAVFADGETPDGAVIEEILRTDAEDQVSPEDVEIETSDRRATTTFTRDLPQSRLPDNSPDVHVGIVSGMGEEGTTALYFTGDGSVDASNLEYRVDGERAEPPWDEDATIESQERFEVDVPPMTHVAVLWVDPELEDVTQRLGGGVVGSREAFEAQYDHDAHELTIEYTADRTLDPGRFEVVQRSQGSTSGDTTPLSEYVDTLERGTEIALSDVQYGDYVHLRMTVDDGLDHTDEMVFWYSADPPGHFRDERQDDGHVLVYVGENEVAAEEFRVLVGEEPADAQWSDVAETLSGGERLELDAEVGDTVTVEYLGEGDPVEVYSREIVPSAEFSFDVGESSVEITHDSGDAMDAESLTVELYPVDGEPRKDAFSEYDTVEAGDSITVEYETEENEELQAVVVLYDGRMVDYAEPGEEDGSGSDEESGSDGRSGSDGGSASEGDASGEEASSE